MKLHNFQLRLSVKALMLFPVSLIYLFLHLVDMFIKCRKRKIFKSKKIVCVGNCVVGGTGKTPFCILLLELLEKKFTVLSKGYGRESKDDFIFIKKGQHATPSRIGDEPCLLKEYADICICNSRQEALNQIESRFILMDDGMQDLTVSPDIRFVLFDASRQTGNGMLLPSGILRSPVSMIKKRDIVVVTNSINQAELRKKFKKNKVIYTQQKLVYDISLKEKKIVAFSGLGNNKKFLNSLHKEGLEVLDFIEFDDHHRYSVADYNRLVFLSTSKNAVLLTTQKDYVKLKELDISGKIKVVDLEMCISDDDKKYIKDLLEK